MHHTLALGKATDAGFIQMHLPHQVLALSLSADSVVSFVYLHFPLLGTVSHGNSQLQVHYAPPPTPLHPTPTPLSLPDALPIFRSVLH